ncbi:MAG: type I restriction enzyme HsdR N-terminal domain-containing protein [Flavobacteriales bacterium]|nr:type I restriction enzyme HsdR N-terminal domain-containing protein [Flavobacteriales bacterium]
MIELPELNMPAYSFRIRQSGSLREIWDEFRKKYVALTPEEWVRQHILMYLTHELGYPSGRMGVELTLQVHGAKLRCDALVYDAQLKPLMLIECKAPEVVITNNTLMQIARYNQTADVNYLLVTNGITHYCFQRKTDQPGFVSLQHIPFYKEL